VLSGIRMCGIFPLRQYWQRVLRLKRTKSMTSVLVSSVFRLRSSSKSSSLGVVFIRPMQGNTVSRARVEIMMSKIAGEEKQWEHHPTTRA